MYQCFGLQDIPDALRIPVLVRVTRGWTGPKNFGKDLLAFGMRPPTLAALFAFIAGVLVTLLTSGKLGVILACRFDWTVFWTAFQAMAVLIAALIALVQLRSYSNTERDKNTIALFRELDEGEIDDTIGTFSASNDARRAIEEARKRLRPLPVTGAADTRFAFRTL